MAFGRSAFLKFLLATLFSMVFVIAGFSQSRIPSNNNYFQNADTLGNGDTDGINVVFFEVPDTVTAPLHFAVFSPGTDVFSFSADQGQTGMITTYTLFGGSGALSGAGSRAIDHSTADPYAEGAQLDQFDRENTDADSWVYFKSVLPSEGEHIGNKYYFKVVIDVEYGAATNSGNKNAYALDVSLDDTATEPTGVAGVRAFAYSWTVAFLENTGKTWDFYPFVPDTAPAGYYVVMYNYDADDDETFSAYNNSETPLTAPARSSNGDWAHGAYTVGSETNGTWRLRVTETVGGIAQNTTIIANTLEASAPAAAAAPSGLALRTYAAPYNPPDPHKVVLTTDDGIAPLGGTERVILQITDSAGNPLPYSRDIYVTVDNSATISAISSGTNNTTNALITTDTDGIGWLDVTDAVSETVNVTAYWDGSGNVTTGYSDSFGSAASGVTTVDFLSLIVTIDSDSDATFTVGDLSTPLPEIVMTTQTDAPAATYDIRIRIPSELAAEFNPLVTPTAAGLTWVGYTDANKTAQWQFTSGATIPAGSTTSIFDLEMRNFTAASTGRLELSWDGGTDYRFKDSRFYTINSTSPVITSRETVDADADGQIDAIRITTDKNLNDVFTGLTVSVAGYTVSGYDTGATANDNIFFVRLTESGTPDTGATPLVTVSANTSLADNATGTNNIAADTGVTSLDAAAPVLISAISDTPVSGGNLQAGTSLTLTFSEAVDINSVPGSMSAVDFTTEPDGTTPAADLDGATAAVTFGAAAEDLVVTLLSGTTGGLWTENGEIDLDRFLYVIDNAGNNAVANGALTEVPIENLGYNIWTGGAASSDWTNGGNWSAGIEPTADHYVVIPDVAPAPFPVLDAASATIFNLQIDPGAELSTGGNQLTITDSFNNDGTLRRRGGDSVNRTDIDSGTVVYEISSTGDIQDYGAVDYYNLRFEDAVTFSTGAELSVAGTLTVGDGIAASTLNAGGNVSADALVINANSVFDAAIHDVTMTTSYDNNGGTLRRYPGTTISRTDIDSGETVYYGGSGAVQDYGATDYFDLTIDGAAQNFTLGSGLSAAGTLTVSAGTLQTGANSLSASAVTLNATLDASGQTGTETFSIAGTTPDLAGTGILTLGAGAADVDGDITLATLTGGSEALNVGGFFVPGAFTANTATVVLDGTDTPVDLEGHTFYNLSINKSAESDVVNSLGALTVTGSLALTRGTWTAGAFTHSIAGDWDSSSADFSFTETDSTILLTGAAPTITTEGAADPFLNLQIAGDAVQGSDLSVGGILMVNTGGSLDTNGSDLSVTGNTNLDGTAELVGGAGAIDLTGDLGGTGVFTGGSGAVSIDGTVSGISSFTESSSTTTLSGAAVSFAGPTGFITASGGTLIFDGISDLTSNGATLGNIQIGTGVVGGSLTALDDLRVGGNFSVGTAATTTLDISSVNMYVAADLDLSNLDTFTVTGSTVYLNGAGNLGSAGHSFNNLSISGPGTVTLQDPLIVLGSLTITGGVLDVNAAGPYQINVGGNWNNSVGTAGFEEQTGTVVLDNTGAIQNAETFYDLQVTAGTRTNSTGFTISNNLTVSGTGALELSGGMSVTGLATVSAGTVTADTGGTVSIGTLTLSGGDLTVSAPAALNVTTGDFSITDTNSSFTGNGNVTVDNGDLFISAGAYDAAGASGITVGDLLVSGGTSSPTGTVNAANASFTGAGTFTASNTMTLGGSLTMSDGTLDGTGTIDIGGDVSLTNAAAALGGDGRTIQVAGDWGESAAVFAAGTGTVIFDGTAPGVATVSPFNNVTVDTLAGPVSLANALDVNGTLSLVSGTLEANDQQINLGGNWTNTGGGFTPGIGPVVFDGTGTIASNGISFSTVEVSSGPYSTGTNLTSSGLWTLTGGTLTINGGTFSPHTLTLNGGSLVVNTPGAVDVTDGDLTIQNAGSGFSGDGTVDVSTGNLSISAGGYTESGATTIAGDLLISGGSYNGTGDVDVNGSVTLSSGVFTDNGQTVTVAGDWNETAAVFAAGTGTVIFDGTAPGVATVNAFNNLTINTATGPITLANALDVDGTLSLVSGTFEANDQQINLGGNWTNTGGSFTAGTGTVVLDGTTQQVNAGGTDGRFHNLTVSAGTTATLITSDLYVDNILTITGASTLDAAARNFTIDTIDFNADTDEFHLAGTQITQSITNADTAAGRTVYTGNNGTVRLVDFYNLAINGTGTFLVNPATITINGDLVLQSGTLNGNGNLIRIQGDFNGAAGGTFAHGNGTVQYFGLADALISGDNTFYNFVADDTIETDLSDGVLGKIIQIASGSTQSIAAGGRFQVRGDNTDPPNGGDPESEDIWSLRTYTTSWITLRSTDDTAPPHWTLDIDGTAALDMQYVDVWFSHAVPALNVPADTYVHDCIDWLRFIYVSDSFTRDTNGNGRIDIIEVVVPVNLDDNFTDFEVIVDGYEQSGPVDTGASPNDRVFWIRLEEKSYPDTDARPSWYILDSGELRDSATSIYQVVHEPPKGAGNPEVPWDDADPVVGYTLAVPGKNEVFIHFSESVYGSGVGGALVPEIDISGPAGNTVSTISTVSGSGGGQEVLLTMASPVSATDIADGSLLTFANIDDNAPDPLDVAPVWADQPDGPNALADGTNRISDLGLGISGGGLVNPVWASDGTSISPERGGLGLIRSFDGSAFLQDDDILLEASVHPDLAPLGSTPEILFDGNVPANYTSDSLWLPESADSNGLVPFPYPDASTRSITGSAHPSGSDNLWQFTFPSGDVDIRTGVQLDFFFKLTGANPLYVARLEQPNASDWYRSVRPWSFRIQDLVKQTARVSIFNNVINPEQGEKATLHYVMENSGLVTITVFDLAGDLVNVIERARKTAGEYSTTWNGRNRSGRVVARGIYFIRVVGPGFDEYRKVMVVK